MAAQVAGGGNMPRSAGKKWEIKLLPTRRKDRYGNPDYDIVLVRIKKK
jgi:hypothetical protein